MSEFDQAAAPIFRGECTYALDDKRRFSIPGEYARQTNASAGTTFIAFWGFDEPCLLMYPENAIPHEIKQIPLRLRASFTSSLVMQKGYRFGLTDDHLKKVEITSEDKNLVVVGAGHHFEIWSKRNWDKKKEQRRREISKSHLQIMAGGPIYFSEVTISDPQQPFQIFGPGL